MRRDVFQAIADPTRRAILGLLAVQTLTVNGIAEHFKVSRPAISKHIRILEECELVKIEQKGRERYCQAKLKKLSEVDTWLEQYRQEWEQRLDRLEDYLASLQTNQSDDNKG
jgi:DNA-binding transcriptional ArsR family regulator